jgi:site-specific recombinase XerD
MLIIVKKKEHVMSKKSLKEQSLDVLKESKPIFDFPEYEQYLRVLKTRSPRTIMTYAPYQKTFLDMFEVKSCKDIENITADQIRQFRDEIPGGETTKNLGTSAVRALINWLFDEGKTTNALNVKRVKNLVPTKLIKRSLTKQERDNLVRNAKYADVKCMMAMLSFQGLRRDEAINLKKSDYNKEKGIILVAQGKGNKQRQMKVHPVVVDLLDKYLSTRKDDCEYIFVCHRRDDGVWHSITGQAVFTQLKASVERAKIDHPEQIHPHTLRRSFATLLYKDGVPVATISKLMGHSDIKTTMLYIDVQQDDLDDALVSQSTTLDFSGD